MKILEDFAFIFNKLLTFNQREGEEKMRKDLYYVYYMLRFSEFPKKLTTKVSSLINSRNEGKNVVENIKEYFNNKDSKGPVFIERENGPDEFINDVRKDAYSRIIQLIS